MSEMVKISFGFHRGNLYITIIYLPSGVDKGEVEKIAKGYLGFYEEGVI